MQKSNQSTDTVIEEKDHLIQLKSILGAQHRDKLYYCIADLAENGICQSRFGATEPRPDRQQVTQYVASWFKHAGLSAEECQGWLTDYAVNVLGAISSSGSSQIRHSTKSNVKFIYKAEVPYECGCENNPFKAHCEKACVIYADMAERVTERERQKREEEEERRKRQAEIEIAKAQQKAEEQKRKEELKKQTAAKRTKARKAAEKCWLETCGAACKIALEHRQKGLTMRQTAQGLNDAGFRTSTDRSWTDQSINLALKRYQEITGVERQKSLFTARELKKLESQKNKKKVFPERSNGHKHRLHKESTMI